MLASNNFPFPSTKKGSLPAEALAKEGPGWGSEKSSRYTFYGATIG